MNTWLDEHLETFVRPHLGSIPEIDKADVNLQKWFEPVTLKCLHAVWKKIKLLAQDRVILLPGRDVWLIEVIARMQDDHPTVFRKEISSCVARSKLLTDDFSKLHCLDTGYRGTVPMELGCEHWHLISWNVGPQTNTPEVIRERIKKRAEHQLFPGAPTMTYGVNGVAQGKYSPIITLAGQLEGCPKYWDRGEVVYDKTHCKPHGIKKQVLFEGISFKRAAMLTRFVAESCGPSQKNRHYFINHKGD